MYTFIYIHIYMYVYIYIYMYIYMGGPAERKKWENRPDMRRVVCGFICFSGRICGGGRLRGKRGRRNGGARKMLF